MSECDTKAMPLLTIYAQASEHFEAEIRGTSEGLRRLRAAIDAALSSDEPRLSDLVFPSDGEHYRVEVTCCDDESMEYFVPPYDLARDSAQPAQPKEG